MEPVFLQAKSFLISSPTTSFINLGLILEAFDTGEVLDSSFQFSDVVGILIVEDGDHATGEPWMRLIIFDFRCAKWHTEELQRISMGTTIFYC